MSSQRNVLFVIALDKYHIVSDLNNAVRDAKSIVAVLQNKYNFNNFDTVMLLNEEATRKNIYTQFKKLVEKLTPEDNLVIYYAGHGYFDQTLNMGYWLPYESELDEFSYYISNLDIVTFIKYIKCRHVFLIADACFAGSFFRNDRQSYIERVELLPSRWALTSGRIEPVSDGNIGQNSPFAECLLQVLNHNNKSELSVSEIVQKVQFLVGNNNDQTPQGRSINNVGDEGGEMIFRLSENSIDSISINAINPDDTLTAHKLFCFNDEVSDKLKEMIVLLQVEKAEIAFIERRDLPKLKHYFEVNNPKNRNFESEQTNKFLEPREKDIMSVFYLKSGQNDRYVYYPDIQNRTIFKTNLKKWEYDFEEKDFLNFRSIILISIFSEGQVVGVIKFSSKEKGASDNIYLEELQKYTIKLGKIFRELELRNIPLREIDLEVNSQSFQELMDRSNLLKNYEMNYLFYKIDYREGKLIAMYGNKVKEKRKNKNKEFSYSFNDESLATLALKKQHGIHIKNIDYALEKKLLSLKGVEEFNISGSIYATPVKAGNYICFILVGWSGNGSNFHTDRIFRLAHLIANSVENIEKDSIGNPKNKAKIFIDATNKDLRKIDQNNSWSKILHIESKRNELVRVLMKMLIHEASNFGRARLWVYIKKKEEFKCIYSISQTLATGPGENEENQFLNITTSKNDIYCQYTIERYQENPHAMHQHMSMFGKLDPNWVVLNKDPDGKWVVGPIVNRKSNELLGFISADNHFIENGKPKDIVLSEKQDAFQKYVVDLISDLLTPILRYYKIDSEI